MGLLTDPRVGTGKMIKLLIRWEKPLCYFLYLSGVIWFLLLVLPALNDKTYFSENALLPGLVTRESNLEQTSKQYYNELVHEMKRYPDSMPYAWLSAKFHQLHLDVYSHNFSLMYPFKNQKFSGQNIYGIVRAPRAASTEGIVISVPYRPVNSVHMDTAPSIALLLAFAKFCTKQKYWAKDIIFLITEHEQLGMQAWLDAYHGVTSGSEGVLMAGDLTGRSGSIQTAINLELHSMRISSIDVKIEGLNGQLPNLDLFNLAQSMIEKEGIRQSFQRRFDVHRKNKYSKWLYQFRTLVTMMATQATGVPTGNHGLFHRFGIEAITLEGFKKSTIRSDANYYQVGRVVESIIRSLNNLLERFHQSFFFYLLPSTDRYISIGVYMRPMVLIIIGLFIKAFSTSQKLQVPTLRNEDKKVNKATKIETEQLDLSSIASEILWAHIFGGLMISAPHLFTSVGTKLGISKTDDSIYIGFCIIAIFTLLWPFCFKKKLKYETVSLISVIVSVELGTTLMCIAVHNFSLALITALIYVPAVLAISPKPKTPSRCRKLLYIAWTVLHPFFLLSIVVTIYAYVHFSDESIISVISRGFYATKQAFVFGIVDSLIYGNWFYNVTVTILLPIWVLFWRIISIETMIVNT